MLVPPSVPPQAASVASSARAPGRSLPSLDIYPFSQEIFPIVSMNRLPSTHWEWLRFAS
jgi:hypothetical protein